MEMTIGTVVKMMYKAIPQETFKLIGFNCLDLVFMPLDEGKKQVLIYSKGDVAELLEKGHMEISGEGE